MTEPSTGAQDYLMAELKRVGTQQQALKKAVEEEFADAHADGQSFSISPLKGLAEPGTKDKSAGQVAAPEAPSIQAKWTDSPSPSRQGSQDAAMPQSDSAALQTAKGAELDDRAESLQERYRIDQITLPAKSVEPPQTAPLPAAAKKRSTLPPELIAESGVAESRKALARMQVALGGHDDSSKAAFDPAQYTFDKLPSQDKRSMEERRHDHDKLVAQRHEEERLKKKGKEWKEEQKRLAAEKEEEEAAAVKNQLLQADLGPTPSRPGGGPRPRVEELTKPVERVEKTSWWRKLW